MDQEQKRRKEVDEDTTNILLEYIEAKEVASRSRKQSKPRSRTESVEKARELLQQRGGCRRFHTDQVVVTETESEGFVVLSTEQAACPNNHLQSTCTASACGASSPSVKRPNTLALQTAPDPGDPPLFSPCQPTGSMPGATKSLPVLNSSSKTCSGNAAKLVPSDKCRAKVIAEKLKEIGDKIDNTKRAQTVEEQLTGLILSFSNSSTSGFSFWRSVTQIFRGLYELLSLLKSQFGEMSPPDSDERWQLFLKTLGLLRHDIVPLISSRGGWGAFLRSSECEVVSPRTDIFGSPLLSRSVTACTPHSLPTTHSTPILPQCTPRVVTSPSCRRLHEFQPSPGSARSLKMTRSHNQPAKSENHPRKLWSLSESGSLVDQDGNDDFEESLKSDLGGSTISLENAGKVYESSTRLSDTENEKDDLVFPMETAPPHSASSPAVVPAPHQEELDSLYDSGIISSLDTLSLSSTPPRDVSFSLGNTPLHTDSAVDVSTPQSGKKRPKSGCSFPKEVQPFDRARSRSVPVSRRSERPFKGLQAKKSRKSAVTVISSSPPCERASYANSSLSLSSISEAVLYEAVCSLLR